MGTWRLSLIQSESYYLSPVYFMLNVPIKLINYTENLYMSVDI